MISSNMSERLENYQDDATNKDMEISKKKMLKKEMKKQDMINKRKLLKQQQLTREIDMSTRNSKRCRRIWRQKMMEMKIPDMRDDVEIAKNTFYHALDIKKYCANLLLECLDKCEDQYQRNVNHHIEVIDKFGKIYQTRLNAAKDFHEHNLEELIKEYNSDMKKIKFSHDEFFLEVIIYQGRNQMEKILHDIKDENDCKLESLRNTGYNVTKIAMVHIEEKMSSTWASLNTVLSKYLKDIGVRRLSYLSLKQQDNEKREIIVQQLKETAQLTDFIFNTKSKISKLREESNKNYLKIFTNDLAPINKKKRMLYDQQNNEQTLDKFQLNLLTTQYNLTVEHLQNLVKKASTILFLIRSCRKFLMHSEKLLPCQVDQTSDDLGSFSFFWYRVGVAEALREEYQCKKEILQKENSRLLECVKQRNE